MGGVFVLLFCLLAIAVAASCSPDVLADNIALAVPVFFRPHVDELLRSEPAAFLAQHARHIFFSLVGLAIAYRLYTLFFTPFYLVRSLEERGYVNFDRQGTMKEVAQAVIRRRMRGDLPPVYPNGWFRVCNSSDLKVSRTGAFALRHFVRMRKTKRKRKSSVLE